MFVMLLGSAFDICNATVYSVAVDKDKLSVTDYHWLPGT